MPMCPPLLVACVSLAALARRQNHPTGAREEQQRWQVCAESCAVRPEERLVWRRADDAVSARERAERLRRRLLLLCGWLERDELLRERAPVRRRRHHQ